MSKHTRARLLFISGGFHRALMFGSNQIPSLTFHDYHHVRGNEKKIFLLSLKFPNNMCHFPPGYNISPSSACFNNDQIRLQSCGEFGPCTQLLWPDAVLSLQVTCWAYHALWPLNVTLAFNVRLLRACLGAPGVYLSGGYRPVVNPKDPHCHVIASGPAMTRVKRGRKWRSDSLKQLCGRTPFVGSSPFNPSSRLRSIYYSICLYTEVHTAGTPATRRRERWTARQGSSLTT